MYTCVHVHIYPRLLTSNVQITYSLKMLGMLGLLILLCTAPEPFCTARIAQIIRSRSKISVATPIATDGKHGCRLFKRFDLNI